MHDCSGGRGTTGGMGIGSGISRFMGIGSVCGWGGASCSPRGTSSVTYSIGPHGRGCGRARGATIGRGARGGGRRRTRARDGMADRVCRDPPGNSGARETRTEAGRGQSVTVIR